MRPFTTTVFKLLLLVLALFVSANTALCCSGNPKYTSSSGTGNPPSPGGGTTYNQDGDDNVIGWTKIDVSAEMSTSTVQWSNQRTLPFSFELNGSQVTDFWVSNNGLLALSNPASYNNGTPLNPNASLVHGALPCHTIAVFWENFSNASLGSNDDIYYRVYGLPPNRQLWIKWHSFKIGLYSYAYFGAVLEETTNNVYVYDANYHTANITGTGSIGVHQCDPEIEGLDYSNAYSLLSGGSSYTDNDWYLFTPIPYTTWTGLISDNWNDPGNWSDGVPTVELYTRIPANCPVYPVIGSAGTYQCDDLRVQDGGSLDLLWPTTISVRTFRNDGILNIMAGKLEVVGTANFYKTATTLISGITGWTAGEIEVGADAVIQNKGALTISSGGTFDANGPFNATGATITNSGRLELGSTVTSLGTLNNGAGTVVYDGGAQTVLSDYYYNLILEGTGTKTPNGEIRTYGAFNLNSSKYELGDYDHYAYGNSTINDELEISSGDFSSGSFDATNGIIDFTSTTAGRLLLSGTVTSLGTLDNGAGTVQYTGTATKTVDANTYYNLDISGGVNTAGGNVTVVGAFQITSGTYSVGSGTTATSDWVVLSSGATLSTGTGSFIANGTSVLAGTLSGTGTYDANGPFSGIGSISLTGSGRLEFGVSPSSLGTLSNTAGTVVYDGASQTVLFDDYYNLEIDGSGIKTPNGDLDIDGDLTISAGTLDVGSYTVTVSGSSDINNALSISTGTYNADGAFDATGGSVTFTGAGALTLSSTVTSLGTFTESTSTVIYDGTAQTIDADTYYNLTLTGSSPLGKKIAGGNIDVTNDLTNTNSSTVFQFTDYDLTVSGATTNPGYIQGINAANFTFDGPVGNTGYLGITSGVIDINNSYDATGGNTYFGGSGRMQFSGTVTSLGTLTEGTGTLEYDGGTQTVLSETYYNLEIDGSATKTTADNIDVDNDLTLTAGYLDIGSGDYVYLAGNMTGTGSITGESGSYLELDGSGSQNINAFSDTDIRIKVDNTGGTITTTGDIDAEYIWMKSGAGTFIIDGETVTLERINADAGTLQLTSGTLNLTDNSSTNHDLDGCALEISGGTFNVGEQASDNLADLNMTGGSLTVSGSGTVNIADQFTISGGTITQTGGTINIASYTGSGQGNSADKFSMSAGTLNLTGGTMNLQGQASSSYDAMYIKTTATVNANAAHTIGITSTGSNDEDIYLDIWGHDIGNITMNNSNYKATFVSGAVILGDITVTAGELDLGTSTATISGDFTLPSGPGLDVDNATISMGGSSQQTITSNGGTIGNLVVNNSSGGVVMADDATISGTLTLTSGVVSTGSNVLTITNTAEGAISGGDNTSFINGILKRLLAVGDFTYSYPIGNGTSTTNYFKADIVTDDLDLAGSGDYLQMTVSSITETGNLIDANLNISEDGTAIINVFEEASWDMEPSSHTFAGGSYGVKLYTENITGLEDNKFTCIRMPETSDHTTYASWVTDDATTTIPAGGQPGRTVASGYMQKLGYTAFSNHAGGGSGDPLPIELVEFNADLNDEGTVDITWATASEMNNEFFTIERSTDGADFETIIEREGAGTSNQLIEYAAVDRNPLMGTSYYRLKQTDYDGQFEYSELRVVKVLRTLNFSVRPNPATDRLEITFENISGGSVFVMTPEYKASIKIYNTAGKLVYKKKFDGNFYKFNIDVSSFDEGMYLVNLETDGQVYKTKFLKE